MKTEDLPGFDLGDLKQALRAAVLRYRRALGTDLDCGANMAAVIRPGVGAAAREANTIARRLRAIDPEFPSSWIDYPEGRA